MVSFLLCKALMILIQSLQGSYYSQLPSLLGSKLTTICAPVIVPVNSNLITNNSGLTYTLDSVLSRDGQRLPSLIHLGNVIQDCEVGNIVILMEGPYARTAAQIALNDWGVSIKAQVGRNLELDSGGSTTLGLTVSWDPLTFSSNTMKLSLKNDISSQTSLDWGTLLLSIGWLVVAQNIHNQSSSPQLPAPFLKAETTLAKSGLTLDTLDSSFYNVSFRGIAFPVNEDNFASNSKVFLAGGTPDSPSGYSNIVAPNTPLSELLERGVEPNIWQNVDLLAKTFESCIITDLDQQNVSWNVLTNIDAISNFSATFNTQLEGKYLHPRPNYNFSMHSDDDILRAQSNALGVSLSVFGATYLCNVPTRKPIGNLILSILVADLVLLRTAWTLFKFVADYFVRKKDEKANYCKGCLEVESDEGLEAEEKSLLNKDSPHRASVELGPPSTVVQENAGQSMLARSKPYP